MRKVMAPLAGALALTILSGIGASPALAQDDDKDFQIKLLGTAVLPDGEITSVNTDLIGLPADTQTTANDNVVPTVAIEYFFNDNFSLETICCVTQHDVDAVSGLPGAELVSDARVIPATFTLKYHANPGGISPYVGAGATYFIWFNEEPGAATVNLGATDFSMSDELGFVVQAGIDVPLGDSDFLLSLDAKKYWVDTTARWYAGDTLVIETEHQIDPWVLSAGVGIRY